MPQGPGTYGSQRGRPSKKESGFKMRGSPFQRNFGVGRTEAPEKESPLNRKSYEERQRAKATKLHKRAVDIEDAEKRGEFSSIFYSADRARRRAEKAEVKATAGSRKTYKKWKNEQFHKRKKEEYGI